VGGRLVVGAEVRCYWCLGLYSFSVSVVHMARVLQKSLFIFIS
jgi:hypothetical protein